MAAWNSPLSDLKYIVLYRYARPFYQGVRKGLLLKLRTYSGQISWGEIAPLPGFSRESLCQAERELRQILPHLQEDPDLSYYSPSVQFGVKSALFDLELPVDLPPIPVNALVYVENLSSFDPNCYESVKIKVGHVPIKDSVKMIRSAKAKLENLTVRIDANQAWSLEDAIFFAESCLIPQLDYFEDPLKELQDLIKFPYPIALDESFRQGFENFPQPKALVFKPTLQKWISSYREKNVDFILSSSYETEVGLAQIAKLVVRENLPMNPMGLDTYRLFKDSLFEEGLLLKDRKLHFPKHWNLKPGGANVCFRMSF